MILALRNAGSVQGLSCHGATAKKPPWPPLTRAARHIQPEHLPYYIPIAGSARAGAARQARGGGAEGARVKGIEGRARQGRCANVWRATLRVAAAAEARAEASGCWVGGERECGSPRAETPSCALARLGVGNGAHGLHVGRWRGLTKGRPGSAAWCAQIAALVYSAAQTPTSCGSSFSTSRIGGEERRRRAVAARARRATRMYAQPRGLAPVRAFGLGALAGGGYGIRRRRRRQQRLGPERRRRATRCLIDAACCIHAVLSVSRAHIHARISAPR
eukprot:SAG31_NODE_3598_length_4085_cov_4.935273_5_plen_275_part_00